MVIRHRRLLALVLLLLAEGGGAAASTGGPAEEDEGPITVTGHRLPIVVRGRVPRCRPREGDPADAVYLSAAAAYPGQQVIRIDRRTGRLGLFSDDYPETGLEVWQRVGERLDTYEFRVPEDGQPLCIGARGWAVARFAQLRRAFVAHPYWGQIVRFTASVATRRADQLSYWLASGAGAYVEGRQVELGSNIVAGGDNLSAASNLVQAESTYRFPITGSQSWMPVGITIGPIPCSADQISYGITLLGGGDVWMAEPKFEVVPDSELPARWRKAKRSEKYRNCEAKRAEWAREAAERAAKGRRRQAVQ